MPHRFTCHLTASIREYSYIYIKKREKHAAEIFVVRLLSLLASYMNTEDYRRFLRGEFQADCVSLRELAEHSNRSFISRSVTVLSSFSYLSAESEVKIFYTQLSIIDKEGSLYILKTE